jgi:hypothetical protein
MPMDNEFHKNRVANGWAIKDFSISQNIRSRIPGSGYFAF